MKHNPNDHGKKDYKQDRKIIKESILAYYHEGHVQSDPSLYEHILHDKWKFFLFDDNNQLQIVNKAEYQSWYNPQNVNADLTWHTSFYYIDVTENIAAVKLKIECEDVGYIDYFNLMKIQGKWWIVHKISHKIH